jgi:hypothetical protein
MAHVSQKEEHVVEAKFRAKQFGGRFGTKTSRWMASEAAEPEEEEKEEGEEAPKAGGLFGGLF